MNVSQNESAAAASACRCFWWCAVCSFFGIYSIVVVMALYSVTRLYTARATLGFSALYMLPIPLLIAPCVATYAIPIRDDSALGLLIRFSLTLLTAFIAILCFHSWLSKLDRKHLQTATLNIQRWCLWGFFPFCAILSWPVFLELNEKHSPRYTGFFFMGFPMEADGWQLAVLLTSMIAATFGYFGALFNFASLCTQFREEWLKFRTRRKESAEIVDPESDSA